MACSDKGMMICRSRDHVEQACKYLRLIRAKVLHVFAAQYLGWGVAATATPLVMLLAGGTFFWTSMLARVGGAAASLAAAGATAGAVTQASRMGPSLSSQALSQFRSIHVWHVGD
jgi:hypothetical protein